MINCSILYYEVQILLEGSRIHMIAILDIGTPWILANTYPIFDINFLKF